MFEYDAQAVRRSEKRPTRFFFLDQQVRQVGQEPNPPIPGQPVTTYYEVSEALVTEGMWKAGMGDIKDNDDLYLYAIMVSIDGNGNVRKGPFYTLDEIKRAEPWAHPDDLDDYFGIHVPYRSAEFPVDVIAKTVNGKVIEQPQATFLKGKYKVGETIDHEFPETIEDNGKKRIRSFAPIYRPSRTRRGKTGCKKIPKRIRRCEREALRYIWAERTRLPNTQRTIR